MNYRLIKSPLLIVAIFVCVFLVIFGKQLWALGYRTSPKATAFAFWNALRTNNITLAKGLTEYEEWERIDDWSGTHQTISCDTNELQNGPTSSGSLQMDSLWQQSTSFSCIAETGKPYCFAVNDIKVHKTLTGWLIVDWSIPIESFEIGGCIFP